MRHRGVPHRRPQGEGFGLTALEAMAAARPVVATRLSSLPEVVEDGVTGVLVPPSSVESLRAALVELARNPDRRAAMGEAGAGERGVVRARADGGGDTRGL